MQMRFVNHLMIVSFVYEVQKEVDLRTQIERHEYYYDLMCAGERT